MEPPKCREIAASSYGNPLRRSAANGPDAPLYLDELTLFRRLTYDYGPDETRIRRYEGRGVQAAISFKTLKGPRTLIGAGRNPHPAAAWAIAFYEKHSFHRVPGAAREALLKAYWAVPDRQIEASVVLSDPAFEGR